MPEPRAGRRGARSRLDLSPGIVIQAVDVGPSRSEVATVSLTAEPGSDRGRTPKQGQGQGQGEQSAVLLLHGIGMTSASLEPVAHALASTHRAVCLTLPGHGGSPRPHRALAVEDYAEAASDAADRLGLDRVIVVGQSMGAQFAVALARLRPDLVSGLVLIGPVVDDAHPTALAQGRALALDSTRETLRANLIVTRDYLRCGPRWYASTLRAMLAYPMLERATGLAVPTIVVRGAGDPIAGSEWVERLAGSMRDARVVTLPGPHHAQLVGPGDVAALVRGLDARTSRPRQGPARASETDQHGNLTIHGRRSNA